MNAPQPSPARRTWLRRSAAWIGAGAALGAGFAWWGARRPGFEFVRSACRGVAVNADGPSPRVLVAYATRAGSTAEVAQAIGQALCEQGLAADVRPVGDVASLDGYSAVVLGSAIRYSAWLPEMLAFVDRQRSPLGKLPTALFTLHMQALDDSAASRAQRATYVQGVRALLPMPAAEAFFAGLIDLKRLSFFERLAVKMVKSPVGDRRDWAAIRAWAGTLRAALRLPPRAP